MQGLRAAVAGARRDGKSIGFAPTMGALHGGHLALVRASRAQCDLTVMSIYVNPSQFGPGEDFACYPRDLDRDRELAASAGVDLLFTPRHDEIFPGGMAGQAIWIDPGSLGASLEGEFRPNHFRGVATVVAKLLGVVRPDRAYLGQKDAQQAIIVERLNRDLNFGVDISVVPTVREPDGLALSSRNIYLSGEERRQAPILFRALSAARQAFEAGEHEASTLLAMTRDLIATEAPLARIQYVAISDIGTLACLAGEVEAPALLSLAAFLGSTRLIDNVLLTPER